MIDFVNAKGIKLKNEYSERRVNDLVSSFNRLILDKKDSSGRFRIEFTNPTDDEPLNPEEFEAAKLRAENNGWELTKHHRFSNSRWSSGVGRWYNNPAVTTYYLAKIKPPQDLETPVNFEK